MSESAFFKVKSSKRSNPESRTTLDAIHQQKVQTMMDQKANVQTFRQELDALRQKIKESTSDMEIWRWERDAEQLEKKIKSIEDDTDLMDYYLRTGDILYNYYDIQDQIQQGNASYSTTKAKPGSILAILEEVAEEEKREAGQTDATQVTAAPTIEKKSLQRHQLLNDYLQLEDPAMARSNSEEHEDMWTVCDLCGHK